MERVCINRFLLSEINIEKHFFERKHLCDVMTGKERSTIAFVAKGDVAVTTSGRKIMAHAGDVIYFPDESHYTAEWFGSRSIEYYYIHFRFSPLREIRMDRAFGIKAISSDKTGELGSLFEKIYFNFLADDEKRLLALSDFYYLFSRLLSHMETPEKLSFSPAVTSALSYIESDFLRDFSVAELAAECHMSESRLYHKFKEEMNCTPVYYRNHLRIQKAIELLKEGELSVGEISDRLNFHSVTYFRKVFQTMTGLSPMEYKKIWREQK